MKNAKKMLLVEPVYILQKVIRAGMIRLGWEVDVASDEVAGLEKALTNPFDLILIDISQEMDGFSLIGKIKEKTVINKATSLCTVTVHDIPENREKARALGIDAFFEGVFLNKVVEEIDAFMANRRENCH